ncbi:MAG: cyclic nucleotide-binding domain-containing protein [Clostridia bacterium]|nr:cyclic nucleotide-binding domain-containing protein [Clostridia bacterium]
MKEYLKAVLDAQLFKGINVEQAEELLANMSAKLCSYEKDDIIQWEQSRIDSIGILISGSAVAYRSTEGGNNIIMSHLSRSDVFADIIAASPTKIP